ncbi:CLUMA_CG003973, isoform A [Clunio marinus]|uniref:CLUMA_CG003973, isoform A n=1 Tax=Clunio marinus TaxID=568069 RepID=A0A1J1HUT2_9DIPT|nr:CLUMA_CG003973, isoform A [Clunio marinus]
MKHLSIQSDCGERHKRQDNILSVGKVRLVMEQHDKIVETRQWLGGEERIGEQIRNTNFALF